MVKEERGISFIHRAGVIFMDKRFDRQCALPSLGLNDESHFAMRESVTHSRRASQQSPEKDFIHLRDITLYVVKTSFNPPAVRSEPLFI